jgi:uncharacterized membrane protein
MKLLPEHDYHELFRIGILVKAVDGVIEVIAGAFIYFANYTAVNAVLFSVFRSEITENPRDLVWGYFINEWHYFLFSSHTFWGLLFMVHGTTKLVLSGALLKNQLWAYPTAAIVFTLFVGYEFYSALSRPSLFLWLITILDATVVALIFHEYRKIKRTRAHAGS